MGMDTVYTATAAVVFLVALARGSAQGDGVTPAVESPTRASCTEEQVLKCQKAAEDGSLGTLEGGGSCRRQQYVHYTHACTVHNYRPHVDFCCCTAEVKVLCCRYQQAWDRFRCSEAEDTIHTLWPKSLPLYILLPCILGPVLFLACCIYCCIRHCRYCHNDDSDEETKWGCSCLSPEKKKHGGGVTDPTRTFQFQNSHSGLSGMSENEPLNSLPPLLADGAKRPLGDCHSTHTTEGSRLMPSAPPLDDSGEEMMFSPNHCHHHHLPHHYHRQPASLNHQSNLPVSHTGSYTDPPSGGGVGGYGRQPSVVSAPPAVYGRQDGNAEPGLPPPCTATPGGVGGGGGGGCTYTRQECAPSYAHHPAHPVDAGADGTNGHHYGGVHINVNGPRPGGHCPSCSTAVFPPPTYDESLQHQVLHQ